MAESFYVLVGTVSIYDGHDGSTPAGRLRHVPPGGIHGFRNKLGQPASMLLHFAPGAPREGYFEGLARFGTEGRPGPDEAARLLRRARQLLALNLGPVPRRLLTVAAAVCPPHLAGSP